MRILIVKRDKLGDLLLARPVISRLKAELPEAKAVIVENKPGGGGLVATSWFFSLGMTRSSIPIETPLFVA